MQFSTLFYVFSLTAPALANLHWNAICIDQTDAGDIYNDAATKLACDYYLNRNKGTEWWNTCPDCVMITENIPHCYSADKHIGGDEITYYCQLAGAGTATTN